MLESKSKVSLACSAVSTWLWHDRSGCQN